MPDGISVDQYLDLIATTQRELGRPNWAMAATDIRNFSILGDILAKQKVMWESGTKSQWDVMTRVAGGAHFAGFFAEDTITSPDVMQQAVIDILRATHNYSFDLRAQDMNEGPARIIDLVQVKRAACLLGLAEMLEVVAWFGPATPAEVNDRCMGILTAIQRWPAGTPTPSASQRFTGGNPAAFPAGYGGLSSVTYTRWRNYAARYQNITRDDALAAIKDAISYTNFKTPFDYPSFKREGKAPVIYAGRNVVRQLESLAENQNDRLGNDLDSMAGKVTIRGIPVEEIPIFETQTDLTVADPNMIVGVNWAWMDTPVQRGWYLREQTFEPDNKQHTVIVTHIDLAMTVRARARQPHWILSPTSSTGTTS